MRIECNHIAQRAKQKSPEDFMKMINLEKLLIVAALLCTPLMATNAQAPSATSPRISTSTNVITCMPGLVYRCNQFGCFCVKP
jgi:hypothetical protein